MGNIYRNGVKFTAFNNRVEDAKIIKENESKINQEKPESNEKGTIELGWDLDKPKRNKFDFIIPIILWGLVALGLLTFINSIELDDDVSIINRVTHEILSKEHAEIMEAVK